VCVCVCMRVCVFVCMYVCAHVYVCVCDRERDPDSQRVRDIRKEFCVSLRETYTDSCRG